MSFAQFNNRSGLRDIETTLYLCSQECLDSSTIELCQAFCPWATLHHGKGGFKMRTLMDLKGFIPIFIRHTEASIHDSKVMDEIPFVANAYYLLDKGYVNLTRSISTFIRTTCGLSQGQG